MRAFDSPICVVYSFTSASSSGFGVATTYHHIFVKEGVEELINLQREGTNAKAYQVRQVRAILRRYHLAGGD